jgi:hypothetical protein
MIQNLNRISQMYPRSPVAAAAFTAASAQSRLAAPSFESAAGPARRSRRVPFRNPLAALCLLATIMFAVLPLQTRAGETPALLDNFDDAHHSSWGIDRLVVTDSSTGGTSALHQAFKDGTLTAEGEIIPGRGQPGWVSLILLCSSTGAPADLSKYEGIRLRVRVRKGHLSITANSTEITNYDYHFAVVPATAGEFQEVKLPFSAMKRAWSEQTPLNRATIASLGLVAVDMQKGAFAYDIDEIGFY